MRSGFGPRLKALAGYSIRLHCGKGQGFVWPVCPAQLGVMFSPSQRWSARLLRCYRPHRVGRLFCLTRCALPRRRHLAAPSLTPFTRFGDWRRFPAPRAVDHCTRLLLCSMWEGDVKAPVVTALGNSMFPSIFCTAYPLRLIDWAQTLSRRSGAFASRGANIRTWDAERHAVGRPS